MTALCPTATPSMAEEADAGATSLAAGDTSVGRVVCAG